MKKFRDFESAREFVRSLGLKNNKKWREYLKSGNKPNNIPATPEKIYKNEWKGYGDWLGTGNISNRDKTYRSFESTREFVKGLNLKSVREWEKYCASGNKPDDIPSHPNGTYKNEFKGWGDWLGTGTVATFNIQFRSFTEAREFVRSLDLKNLKEWNKYCNSDDIPKDIPSHPNGTYKNEWKGYGDWLGTGNISNRDKVYRPYKEAREFVRALNLKGKQEWLEYSKSGNKPDDIPSNPWDVYKEWKKK